MVVLIVISVVILVWGFIAGFESNGQLPVDVLLTWTYIMVIFAILAVIGAGILVGLKNNPKGLVKLLIGLGAVVVVCAVVYLIAPGSPAVGMLEQPDHGTLKLTDTVLYLTYIAGGLAIAAIIFGEIYKKVNNK